MTKFTAVEKWAATKATRDSESYFDLVAALIADKATEADAAAVVRAAARKGVDITAAFARGAIRVANEWGPAKLAERRPHFTAFTPIVDLLTCTPKGLNPTLVPLTADGDVDREATFEALVATGKPITRRDAMRACGAPNYDDKPISTPDTPDVVTVIETLDPASLTDRLSLDPEFRAAVLDAAVTAEMADQGAPTDSPVSDAVGSSTAGAGLDLVALAKKTEMMVRRVDGVANTDPAKAALVATTGLMAAVDQLRLTMLGAAAV